MSPVEAASEALHARVRAFARGEGDDDFERLALAIAHFQAEYSPGFARLVARHGGRLDGVETIPAIPTDAFRLARVAVHPASADVARFVTSGTTMAERGTHAFRTLSTYETVALASGERALLGARNLPLTVVSLAPPPQTPPVSSLGFMMERFQRRWDGRGLDGGEFVAGDPRRWLVSERGVNVADVERAVAVAHERREPLLVLATAFALVALLDVLNGRTLRTPEGSALMLTGGFKGRTREVPAEVLRRDVARAFAVPESHVVGEYGMTELSSQLYEGTLPGAALRSEPGVFVAPPWVRVTAVEPVTLDPVPAGQTGIARIVDLANVDSAVAVQTEDLVRQTAGGIELLGRRAGAVARGCSLAVESLLA